MKSSDKPPKGSNSGTLAAESPVVNNLLLPYLGFLKPMASSPHFDDQDFDFEGGFSGTCSGEKRPSPNYDANITIMTLSHPRRMFYVENGIRSSIVHDSFKAKSKAEEAASGVTTGMILSLRERYNKILAVLRSGYLNKEQDGDLALQMKINVCYSWIFQCLSQLKKLFLLNIRKKEEAARMYEDCQVMSTMGGNVVINSSETLFSSPIQNNSFTFMPTMHFHHSFPTMKEEDGIL
ncbi:hypothetical protein Ahy_B07g088066 isoform B [Arachis hypogaea]|uniref:Uncharacterized protein n=1 Tax=Arachis hypogaea TaxID=3818 RepID=A0A444YDP0_ARAHY|nr:hypothetical protein Ahy_B07g088066 isoform B [Arachis hypogaea]